MSKVDRLLENFRSHISIPWKEDLAAPQRVIFCVYDPTDEKHLRAMIDEFQLATEGSNHGWLGYDLTDTFAKWLSAEPYAIQYYKNPELLPTIIPRYLDYVVEKISQFIVSHSIDENHVLALSGVGSLFGIIRVKELVDRLAPGVPGRLVVFFPGTYGDNNFKLLGGYDGWDYHAVLITAGKN